MIRALKVIYVAGAAATAVAVSSSPRPNNVGVGEHYATILGVALAWPLVAVLVIADIATDL